MDLEPNRLTDARARATTRHYAEADSRVMSGHRHNDRDHDRARSTSWRLSCLKVTVYIGYVRAGGAPQERIAPDAGARGVAGGGAFAATDRPALSFKDAVGIRPFGAALYACKTQLRKPYATYTLPGLYETVSDSETLRADFAGARVVARSFDCLLCGGPETLEGCNLNQ